ncbi:MAG: FtsX-like permease family protein [Chloroflexota bacterium]
MKSPYQGTAFMDLETAVSLLGTFDYNRINIRVHDETQIAATGKAVLAFMQAEGLSVLAKSERTLGDYPGQKAFDKVLKLMALFGLLALILSAFIIINTIVTILGNETSQIGTMKAIGATRWRIMGIYLAVVCGYGLLGGLLGVALGTVGLNLLTRYMGSLANVRVETIYMLPTPVLLMGLALGVVVPLLATFIPITRATGVTVREAILSYGLSNKGTFFDRLLGRLTLLPEHFSLAVRNTFRARGRTLLTLLMVGLAGACFVAIQAMQSSLNRTVDVVGELLASDVSVFAQNPLPQETLNTLIGDEGVAHSEGWLVMGDENEAGESLRLYGLPIETMHYNHRGADTLSAGRYFAAGEQDVVLVTTAWAQQHSVIVGDKIQFGKLLRQEWEVVGIVNDFANEGRVFAVPYTTMAQQLRLGGFSNWVQISLAEGADGEQLVTQIGLEALQQGEQVSATTKEEMINGVKSTFALIVTFISTMGIVVAVVSGLGLVSTLTISVAERVKEIGVMRSIGASDWAITTLFWWEGVLLGLLGWGMSLLIGIPVARAFVAGFAQEFPVVFELNPLTLLLAGIAILSITSLASIFPAVAASRLRIGDILRYG